MGLFNRLFRDEESRVRASINWIPLCAEQDLEDVIHRSFEKPQLIFKHSSRCGISSMVLRQFEADGAGKEEHFDFNFVDILKYRPVSNFIAERFDIIHQSPQMLIVESGQLREHASHGAINSVDLNKSL